MATTPFVRRCGRLWLYLIAVLLSLGHAPSEAFTARQARAAASVDALRDHLVLGDEWYFESQFAFLEFHSDGTVSGACYSRPIEGVWSASSNNSLEFHTKPIEPSGILVYWLGDNVVRAEVKGDTLEILARNPQRPSDQPASSWVTLKAIRNGADGLFQVGGRIASPEIITKVTANYPSEAQAQRVQGAVIVEAVVDQDGRVVETTIKRSIPLLDEAAVAAVRQSRYRPTVVNGRRVSVVLSEVVNFVLQ